MTSTVYIPLLKICSFPSFLSLNIPFLLLLSLLGLSPQLGSIIPLAMPILLPIFPNRNHNLNRNLTFPIHKMNPIQPHVSKPSPFPILPILPYPILSYPILSFILLSKLNQTREISSFDKLSVYYFLRPGGESWCDTQMRQEMVYVWSLCFVMKVLRLVAPVNPVIPTKLP